MTRWNAGQTFRYDQGSMHAMGEFDTLNVWKSGSNGDAITLNEREAQQMMAILTAWLHGPDNNPQGIQ